MPLEPLTAVSPIDGRYRTATEALAAHFSEYALIRDRITVEFEYLIALSETAGTGVRSLTADEKTWLRAAHTYTLKDAQEVKRLERETNHDVKAVEYFIKKRMIEETSLKDVVEWVHFGLTSEDVNSVAYGMALRSSLQHVVVPALAEVRTALEQYATQYAAAPMLARTHGQPASPTTFGKEMRVFEARLVRQLTQLRERSVLVKFAGATGNYNAHHIALPQVDWPAFAKRFIEGLNTGYDIPLELNEATTQIEPHDTIAELSDNMRRINTILIDLSQDMWRYISDGWLTQKPKEGEVGSSAMPHKVNPIDFENAEGNFGLANALFAHFSQKLPISRLQRDLSDSTVERALGTALAHSLIGYRSLARGLGKIRVNTDTMRSDLIGHPEVLAEAIQTVLRKEGVEAPYEKLKELTRGKHATLEDLAAFIDGLDVSAEVKARLTALRPETYIGLAERIARPSRA